MTPGRLSPFSLLCQQLRSLRRAEAEVTKGQQQEVRPSSWPEQYFVSRDCLGKKCTVSAGAKSNYTGTVFRTLFYLKSCNQRFREQMAGVFTLNMKLIQSCICEALGSFIPSFTGVL